GRRVIFVSGDHPEPTAFIKQLVESFAFTVIDLGDLATGGRLQQAGGPLAGRALVEFGHHYHGRRRMRAVQIRTFGEPGIVLELADLPEPPAPAAGEVLIGVEHAPINMNDLHLIQGVYPVRPSLPSVVGNEGVGRVLAIGRGVDHLKVGDRVLVPLYSFSWRERLVAPAAGLFALPEAKVRVSSLDRARDAIDLVAATVDAPRLVEHAIFGADLVDRRAAARGVVFTEA